MPEVDVELCDMTGGGVTNDRHGPAIDITVANTRAAILVMALRWGGSRLNALYRGRGVHACSCSSAREQPRLLVSEVFQHPGMAILHQGRF